MSLLTRDVERLRDGPTSSPNDWRKRWRTQRRIAFRAIYRLALMFVFTAAMKLSGLPSMDLGPIAAGILIFTIAPGIFDDLTGYIDGFFLPLAAVFVVGLFIGGGLHAGEIPANLPAVVAFAGVLAPLAAFATTVCFTGWCAAVPDRDIVVRREWQVGRLVRSAFLPGPLTFRERLAVVILMGGLACSIATAAVSTLAALHDPPGAILLLALAPAAYGAIAPILLGIPLHAVFSASWRTFVIFVAYDRPRADGGRPESVGLYRFPEPFHDTRLRAVMLLAATIAAAVAVVSALGWPRTWPAGVMMRSMQGEIAAALTFLTKLFFLAGAFLAGLFAILAGWFGTFAAFTYREFAERAVHYAERDSL